MIRKFQISNFKFQIILAALLILITFSILPTTNYQLPTIYAADPCLNQTTNPRAGGLISAPEISSNKFSNATGNCVIDLKAAFVSYKIPTYEDLKSLYYTQSKAAKASGNAADQNNLRSLFNNYDVILVNGNVDINGPLGVSKTAAVVFVEGDLTFNTDFGDVNSGIVFVVKGYVSITQTVRQIYAVIISSDKIYTAGYPCTTNSTTANTLTIYGSLISLSPGKIVFCRSLADNTVAAEKIKHEPKYVVILRDLFADTLQRWSEVQ